MTDDALTTFTALRPRLSRITYRMLGSVGEAEDIVQETWIRWQGTDRSVVREASALLATVPRFRSRLLTETAPRDPRPTSRS